MSNKRLEDPERKWKDGSNIAEIAAHLLEAGELTAIRTPPAWQVEMPRQGEVNLNSLKEMIIKFRDQLEPYKINPSKSPL
jgi:hypothetical protein